MAHLDRLICLGASRLTLAARLRSLRLATPPPARLLPWALLLFVAAAFLLPSGPAYALVFYVCVVPAALARAGAGGARVQDRGYALAMALIYWSAATLLWGRDDGHRWVRFAVDAVMTGIFVDTLMWVLREPAQRARLATLLIWAGAANALLSVVLGQFLPQDGPRLHGWGVTGHPILGADVMLVAYLAALVRALSARRGRGAHLAAAATMAAFVLLTESRGPLLSAAASTLFLCAAGPWRGRAVGALAALAAGWWLLPAWMRRHQEAVLVARGVSHRPEIWHRTLQMVADHPLLGNGLAANLDLPGMTFPHDLYLSVLFYSGAVGLALFAWLLAVVLLRLWRARPGQQAPDWVLPDWLWMVALWINALIDGLTDLGQITKGPGPLWFIFWLPAGLVLARWRPPSVSRPAAA